MIATLATRADSEGVRTCVVSTDRDAFQLCSENVCLMMTPRGVADVQVYTPERVEARYGIRPDQIPDFIGLKGDTSDNIPGVPGIGDKTAGRADRPLRLARGGDRARRRAHARPLEGHHRARRPGAALEGARDDAARPRARLRPGPARARPARPLAAEGVLPPLRVPRAALAARHARRGAPGASVEVTGVPVPWREGEPVALPGASASRQRGDRAAVATDDGVVVGPRPAQDRRRACCARRKGSRCRRGRRHADRRVPDRPGPFRVRALRPRRRVRDRAPARARRRRGDGRARRRRRAAAPARAADARPPRGAQPHRALPRDRAAAHARARRHGAGRA